MSNNNKITMGSIISWGLGLFFALGALGLFFDPDTPFLIGLICLAMSALLLPPVRAYVHKFTKKTLSTGVRIGLVIGLLICATFLMPQETGVKDVEQQNQTALTPVIEEVELTESPVVAEPVSKPVETIEYATIKANMETMTDAQFKNFAKQQVGKTMAERGYIEDVREKMFGGYGVWIDMDNPSVIASVQEISFDVDEDTALTLRKDQAVKFSGRVKSIMKVLGTKQITLEDVKISR